MEYKIKSRAQNKGKLNPIQNQKEEFPNDTDLVDEFPKIERNQIYKPKKIEYNISKIKKENYDNDDYHENKINMKKKYETIYKYNTEKKSGNKGLKVQRIYKLNKVYNNQNENLSNNFNTIYNENEPETKIIINNAEGGFNKHIYLPNNNHIRRNTLYNSCIPRYMTFEKSEEKGESKIRGSVNLVRNENFSELIEIPKSEYSKYAGRETIHVGGGMSTGEYKFRGQGIIITQKKGMKENIVFSEDEILKEINKMKNKPKKIKGRRYEVLDKFYALTEYDGEPIYKMEKMKSQYEYDHQMKYSDNDKSSTIFKFKNKKNQISQQAQSKSKGINMDNKRSNYTLKYKALSSKLEPNDEYSKYLFYKINKLRVNPQSYIKTLEDCKKNIIKDKHGRLIYNNEIKILLRKGEEAFNDAINFLKKLKPMNNLIFNPYIVIDLPKNEDDIKNKKDIFTKAENMINEGIIIKSFWRNVIKDPELSLLMLIVDDTGDNYAKRRNDIFDRNMKYIGINSIEINKNFLSYFSLCNEV